MHWKVVWPGEIRVICTWCQVIHLTCHQSGQPQFWTSWQLRSLAIDAVNLLQMAHIDTAHQNHIHLWTSTWNQHRASIWLSTVEGTGKTIEQWWVCRVTVYQCRQHWVFELSIKHGERVGEVMEQWWFCSVAVSAAWSSVECQELAFKCRVLSQVMEQWQVCKVADVSSLC
jgi:hypothetical protein